MTDDNKRPGQHMGLFVRMDATGSDSYASDGKTTYHAWIRAYPVILLYSHGGQLTPEYNGYRKGFKFCGSYDREGYEYLQATTMLSSSYQCDPIGELAFWDSYCIKAHQLEKMLKAVRYLQKRMEKQDAQFGRALTFGQYCVRLANALGAECIILKRDERSADVTGEEWRFAELENGATYVDSLIDEWNKKYRTEADSKAALDGASDPNRADKWGSDPVDYFPAKDGGQ